MPLGMRTNTIYSLAEMCRQDNLYMNNLQPCATDPLCLAQLTSRALRKAEGLPCARQRRLE